MSPSRDLSVQVTGRRRRCEEFGILPIEPEDPSGTEPSQAPTGTSVGKAPSDFLRSDNGPGSIIHRLDISGSLSATFETRSPGRTKSSYVLALESVCANAPAGGMGVQHYVPDFLKEINL